MSLSTSDVIHSVNGVAVSTVAELRARLDGLTPHSPVVLPLEREGMCSFVAVELD